MDRFYKGRDWNSADCIESTWGCKGILCTVRYIIICSELLLGIVIWQVLQQTQIYKWQMNVKYTPVTRLDETSPETPPKH